MKLRTSLLMTCLFLCPVSDVFGATQTVIASISFDTPLALTKNDDISFGVVPALTPATYVISPTGIVTASNGGQILGGTRSGGHLTIIGSANQAVDISVGNYATNAGVMPSAATCSYDNGPANACPLTAQAAPGKGKTLSIGTTVTVDGTQHPGTHAAPSFDVVVSYQ